MMRRRLSLTGGLDLAKRRVATAGLLPASPRCLWRCVCVRASSLKRATTALLKRIALRSFYWSPLRLFERTVRIVLYVWSLRQQLNKKSEIDPNKQKNNAVGCETIVTDRAPQLN